MNILGKNKFVLWAIIAITVLLGFGGKAVYADDIASGIYELENEVYHESETGMAMSRTYLQPTMIVETSKEGTFYTIAFSGSDYMENYRMKLNGEEIPVEVLEDNNEDGIVKLKIEVDKVDADMDAIIYVGPMERDVEFKVIPKMDTMSLIEAIEEVQDEVEEEVQDEVVEEDNTESEENIESDSSNIPLIIGGVVILGLVVGGISIALKKKAK